MTDKSTPGPYRAEFGAIHHEDAPGFLFTVAPATAADEVARALNLAHAQDNRPAPAALEGSSSSSSSEGEALALKVYRHLTNYAEACSSRRENIEAVRDQAFAALQPSSAADAKPVACRNDYVAPETITQPHSSQQAGAEGERFMAELLAALARAVFEGGTDAHIAAVVRERLAALKPVSA